RVPVRGVRRWQAAQQGRVREGCDDDQRCAIDGRALPEVRARDTARDHRQGSVRDLARQCRASGPAGEIGMRIRIARVCVIALAIAGAPLASAAPDDELAGTTVIFARGSSLFQVDTWGKGETEIAQLAAKLTVRALRTDARGTVLLADLAGRWAWM